MQQSDGTISVSSKATKENVIADLNWDGKSENKNNLDMELKMSFE